MRITDLQFIAFGPFTDCPLELSPDGQGIDLVYGLNEAGKSSALRALRALLYGIPLRTHDAFLHEGKNLAIKGTLIGADGEKLTLVRKKKGLFDESGDPIKTAELERMLAGTGEETFNSFFGIDHEALLRGGEDIVKGKGEVGQSLFAAALSRTGLPEVLRGLETDSLGLYKSGSTTGTEIMRLRKDLEDTRKAISNESLSGRKWNEEARALEAKEAESEKLGKLILELEKEKSKLQRLHAAVPKIGQRRQLLEQLDAMGKVVILPPEFAEERSAAVHSLEGSKEALASAQKELRELEEATEILKVPIALIDNEEIITELHERTGAYRKAINDKPGIKGKLDQIRLEIQTILNDLGKGVTLEKAEEMRPDAAAKARIQSLGRQLAEIASAVDGSEREVTRLEKEIKRAKEDIKKLGLERDVSAVKPVLARVQKAGDLDSEIEKNSRELTANQEQLEIELGRLRFWDGTVDELARAKFPSLETVDEYEGQITDFKNDARHASEKVKETDTGIIEIEQKLAQLAATGSVPNEEELEQVRGRREKGWQLVRRAWLDGEDISLDASQYDGEHELPAAYERSVLGADEVADRLRWEANRVAEYASLMAAKDKLDKEAEELRKEVERLKEMRDGLNQEWENQWKPALAAPAAPREMRSWLDERNSLIQYEERVRTLSVSLDAARAKEEKHRAELLSCLSDLGEELPAKAISLAALADCCDKVVGFIEDNNRKRDALINSIEQWEDDLDEAGNLRDRGRDDLKHWRDQWASAVKSLGLGETSLPDEANATLDLLADLFGKTEIARSFEERIKGIDRECGEFEKEVKTVVATVMPDLKGVEPDRAASQMETALKKGKVEKAELEGLNKQIKQKKNEMKRAESAIRLAEAELKRLCKLAYCKTVEELPKAERNSRLFEERKKSIEELENQLIELSAGGSIDDLAKDVEGQDSDSLAALIVESGRKKAQIETNRRELDESYWRAKTLFEQWDGSDEAAELAEKVQEIVACMKDSVERYIRVRMAYLVLWQQIERFREENEEPLLKRASELFAKLTCGSFTALKTAYDDKDRPILVGARPSGELIDIDGLSDGTVDQLYLSLRLSALERQLEGCEPMPFIVDDILVRFDDERALATLQVLEELSKKTQVIFFTHHHRLVELAKKASDGEGIRLHQL